jgi:hypothetical protein
LVILLGLGIFLILKETTQLEWVQKLFQWLVRANGHLWSNGR